MSIISVLNTLVKDFSGKAVYELSSRGPLYAYLKKRVERFVFSEYYDQISPGQYRNGILCQNVEKLTFSDACFDICTSTEVFEHVANDLAGFSEIYRVLRPEGLFVFTVPIKMSATTLQRAFRSNDTIKYLLPPEYHGDRIQGRNQVLVFREYGRDILERLKSQGFATVNIFKPKLQIHWPYVRPVIVAGKV
jgi:SAM-dependent methyltransferase